MVLGRTRVGKNSLFSVNTITFEPVYDISCNTSCPKFMKEITMPNMVKGFANVTEDKLRTLLESIAWQKEL